MIEQKPFEEMKNLLVKIQKIVYSENANSFSTIDKDLLLSYARKFYEEILSIEIIKTEIAHREETIIPQKEEKVEEIPSPVREVPQKEEIKNPISEPAKETPITKEVMETDYPKIAIGGNIEIEIPKIKVKEEISVDPEIVETKTKENVFSHKEELAEIIDLPVVSPKPNFEDLVNKVKEQFDHTSKHQPVSLVSDEEDDDEPVHFSDIRLDMLFDSIASKELSDKLSQSPIQDIGRSMGLNERIFTLNELFDGDYTIFENTLAQLNNAANFDHAKEIISKQIADQYNWLAESKIKKARDFIKLVRRRYI